ncbi:MAG: condensation domain-containing protein [bacterium]|nr:condensation domain-containing protein [bacterium]
MENRIPIVTERGHLFSINSSISMTAKIHGTITKEMVSKALEKVIIRHQILTSTIVREKSGEAFYQINTSKPIEPSYFPYGEINHLAAYIQKEEGVPFDLENGPLLRLIVFKGEDRSAIVLIGHSVLSDGKGYQCFLEELVYYMNQEHEQPEAVEVQTMSQRIALPKVSSLKLATKLQLNALNREWKRAPHMFSNMDYIELFERFRKTHKAPIIIKEINAKSTGCLLHNCEERNVSVTATIMTAFFAVMHNFDRFHRGKDVRAEVTVDLRDNLVITKPPVIANLSGNVYLMREYAQGLSFWDNVKVVDNYLKEKKKPKHKLESTILAKELSGTLLESIPFSAYGGYEQPVSKKAAHLFYQGEKEKGLGIENLGVINYDQEQDVYIDSLCLIPSASLGNDLTVGAVTVNGCLSLCIRYDKVHYSERIVEDMVRAAVNYMWNRT